MRTLTNIECVTILATSSCPICKAFIQVKTETRSHTISTTSGQCVNCKREFIVERTTTVPYKILGGYEYLDIEKVASRIAELEKNSIDAVNMHNEQLEVTLTSCNKLHLRIAELEEAIREFLVIEGIQDYSCGYDVMYDMGISLLKKTLEHTNKKEDTN